MLWSKALHRVSQKPVPRLTNNRTKAFHSISKISFVSDRCDINVVLDISFLKIGQILTELQESEDQNAVNHETNALFNFGSYMGVQDLSMCETDVNTRFTFTQLIHDN